MRRPSSGEAALHAASRARRDSANGRGENGMSANRSTSILFRSACVAALLALVFVANGQTKGKTMHVTSRDGTRIAYDKAGKGPALVVVVGALADRASAAELVQLL